MINMKIWTIPPVERIEAVEAIRVAMLLYMNDHSITPTQIAANTGYNLTTVWKFLQNESPSVLLAQQLVYAYPIIGQHDFICQHCGRLPHFRKE